MKIHTMTPAQSALVAELAADLKPIVAEIEQSIATTKNHYGRYGAILSHLSGGDKLKTAVIFLAMQTAGANSQGLRDGLAAFCNPMRCN